MREIHRRRARGATVSTRTSSPRTCVPELLVRIFNCEASYEIAPDTSGFSSPFFSFSSVSSTSVVSARPIALAAFCRAVLATLAGSMMPS